MSLILDALNRSRQDENPVPGLATQHPVQQITAQRRQYLLWVALSVAVVLIAWLVMERFSAPPPADDIGAPVAELSRNIGSAVNSVTTELKARAATAEQVQQPVAAEPVPVPAVAASSAALDVAQSVTAPVESPVAAPAPVETPSPAPLASSVPEPVPSPVPDTAAAIPAQTATSPPAARDDAVAQLYENRDVAEEPVNDEPAALPARKKRAAAEDSDAEEPMDLDQILREAREEMENASLDEHPVPFLADLSQQTKDGIPTIYYLRHDYSSDVAQSSVTLNGSPVRVGGSPLPGMKVEEILPDSVVLNYQGTQFRLRALNSWVNL